MAHTIALRKEKLLVACVQGYIPKDWSSMSAANLLDRATQAERRGQNDQWFATQAEYYKEAYEYVRSHQDRLAGGNDVAAD